MLLGRGCLMTGFIVKLLARHGPAQAGGLSRTGSAFKLQQGWITLCPIMCIKSPGSMEPGDRISKTSILVAHFSLRALSSFLA